MKVEKFTTIKTYTLNKPNEKIRRASQIFIVDNIITEFKVRKYLIK